MGGGGWLAWSCTAGKRWSQILYGWYSSVCVREAALWAAWLRERYAGTDEVRKEATWSRLPAARRDSRLKFMYSRGVLGKEETRAELGLG